MSGTFNDIDVPPTLCSFAVDVAKISDVVTPELKKAGDVLVCLPIRKDAYDLPDYDYVLKLYETVTTQMRAGLVKAAYALEGKGIAQAAAKMAFGNKLGVAFEEKEAVSTYFEPAYGDLLLEVDATDVEKVASLGLDYKVAGTVTDKAEFTYGTESVSMEEAIASWTQTLEKVFPTRSGVEDKKIDTGLYDTKEVYICKHKVAKPKVFIPVFPGTNCEYDTMKSFMAAGAETESIVFKNMTEADIKDSVDAFEKAINESQILMFSGGFSAGDEPDGSAKFITSVFRNERIKEAVHRLLQERDGLALGICNGFQALVKLGLVPYGEIKTQKDDSPTLTTNSIGRHISKSVYTKVVTNKSPWLRKATLGGVYAVPASHGEGRFVASKEWIDKLFENGQVATQYVDVNGNPTMDEDFNPNGSYCAIEGITSPDGRVLGKMAHSERRGDGVALNICGDQNQLIFESGVEYFK